MLITYTDCRVVDGVGGNQGCEDIFSDSDNISCKLNEAMDTDTLIGSDSKKRKTSAGPCISTLPVRRRRVVLNWSIAKK